jgi:hypothetical protein
MGVGMAPASLCGSAAAASTASGGGCSTTAGPFAPWTPGASSTGPTVAPASGVAAALAPCRESLPAADVAELPSPQLVVSSAMPNDAASFRLDTRGVSNIDPISLVSRHRHV